LLLLNGLQAKKSFAQGAISFDKLLTIITKATFHPRKRGSGFAILFAKDAHLVVFCVFFVHLLALWEEKKKPAFP